MTKELEIVLETGGMSFQFDQFLNVEKEVDKFLNNKENLQRLIAPLLPENLDEIIENKIPIVKDGEDGLTPTDEQLIALIEPRIPEPLKGDTPKKGIDYFTKKELEEVKKSLKVAIMSEMTNHVTKEEVNIKLEEIKKQINKLPTTGGAQFLRQLMDVNVGTPTAQQYGLTYNPSRSEFSLTAITGGGAVDSVNGQTGVVVLDQDDIGDGTTYKQYSQTEKTKLAGIETGAEVNTIDTVSDTTEIDLAITARDLTATIRSGSIDETKLDTSVNASLDLADSALQSSAIGVSVQAYSSVLANTTASFTTTDETKLDNITVTQAVNLDTMESDIAALANGMVYKGNWDASAGTFPGAGSAQTGWFYTVSVGGTVDSVVFNVGDRLIATTDNASTTTYSGNWTQLDATDAVTSVFGRTGNVVATNGDYTASNITNVPAGNIAATDVQAALNELDTEKAPKDDPAFTTKITTPVVHASSSAGLLIEANGGTDIGLLGAGSGTGVTWYGGHNYDLATQDTIAGFLGAGKTLSTLPTATYPSLTELSYLKGATSAIQTQLNAKQATLVSGTNIKTVNSTSLLGSGDIAVATTAQGALADSALQPSDIASGTITARADDINFSGGSDGDVLTVQADGSLALEAPASGGANTALSNLASVAINTSLVSDTDNTDDLGTTLKKWANLFVTTIGATATRVTKGWFTDLEVTNAITGSITGNAATVTTNANLTGDVTSTGNATTIANSAVTLAKMANLAQDQFIGRTTASTGVPETATITAAARTVLDDTTVGAMVDTLGGATSTGTGGLVRATSPTFVTPALGTPASGVATNLTGTATGLTSGITNALKSATTTVDVSAATAPSSGQVLTATSGTAATWQTPSAGGFTSQVKAYLGSNQTISTGFASRATLVLNTESYDTGNEFNTGTYTFTAGATGYYQVCATLNWGSWVANSGFEFYMVIATVEKLMYNLDMNNGTGAWAFNYSQVIKLSATETLSFKAAQYTGSNKTLTGGDYSSWVTITRVG